MPQTTEPVALLTTRQVMQRLNVCRRTLWTYVARGTLAKPHYLNARTARWDPGVIEAFLEKQSYTPR